MDLDLDRVRENVRSATTEDLLDRLTYYAAGMEPEALDLIERELRRRGVTTGQITDHARRFEREAVLLRDGTAAACSFCRRPAVGRRWGWHRVRGRGVLAGLAALLPLFRPRRCYYCAEHRKG